MREMTMRIKMKKMIKCLAPQKHHMCLPLNFSLHPFDNEPELHESCTSNQDGCNSWQFIAWAQSANWQNQYGQPLMDILLVNEWCMNIELTETEGKIFIITTKQDINHGWRWLDTNLPPLFMKHLTKNQHFMPDNQNPIAWCNDQVRHNTALTDCMDALKQTLTPMANMETKPVSKYTCPLSIHTPKNILI